MRLTVVYPSSGPFDAIAQHARGLTDELVARGIAARYSCTGAAGVARAALSRRDDWLLLEYMPYSFGRWGAAPGLVAAAALTRLVPSAPRLAILVHEAPTEAIGWRTWLMGTWQRWQLRALALLSEATLASTEANSALLRRMRAGRRVDHLPIPSNVPCAARDRHAARAQLGLGDEELAITVFGGRHPSRALGHVEAAVAAVARTTAACALLNLGADPPTFRLPDNVRVIVPGPSSEAALSAQLAAGDIYLAPFLDGTSTRRTTFAAALAHGLAVVGTDGAQTDDLLRAGPPACLLTPAADVGAFAAAAARLAAQPGERDALGAAGLELYGTRLSWPVVAEILIEVLDTAGDPRRGAVDMAH